MSIAATSSKPNSLSGWLSRAEAWLDEKGQGAWIAALVVSFILVWPVGLLLLAYMIWSKRMFCTTKRSQSRQQKPQNTGNSAFDAYREDTLRRLEEEQHKFESFLQRLRDARDKAEFDQFMDERARVSETVETEGPPQQA